MQTIDSRPFTAEAPPVGSGAAALPFGVGAEPWCQVVEHADGYTVRFGGGDPDVLKACLESFRGAVPSQRRHWNALTKTWWVDPAVERMLGSLSRWTARWFAAPRVQRSRVPDAAAMAWAALPEGDDVAEGWVLTAEPRPAPAPRAAPHGRATTQTAAPFGWAWGRPAGAPKGIPPWSGGSAGASTRSAAQPSPNGALLALHGASADPYAALWLRPGAPWPVIRAAYRALAAIHHPDCGGDSAKMQDLNAAYALLRHREGESASPASRPPAPAASGSAAPADVDEEDADDRFSL